MSRKIACFLFKLFLTVLFQYIPDVKDLIEASVKTELRTPSYCPSDLLRMERKVLDKLAWDLNPLTPLTMLELVGCRKMLKSGVFIIRLYECRYRLQILMSLC